MVSIQYFYIFALAVFGVYGVKKHIKVDDLSCNVVDKTKRTVYGEIVLTDGGSKKEDYTMVKSMKVEGEGDEPPYKIECYEPDNPGASPVHKAFVYFGESELIELDVTSCSEFMKYIHVLEPEVTDENGSEVRVEEICYKLQGKWIKYTIIGENTVILKEHPDCDVDGKTDRRRGQSSGNDGVLRVRTILGQMTLADLSNKNSVDANWKIEAQWKFKGDITYKKYRKVGKPTVVRPSYKMECYKHTASSAYKIVVTIDSVRLLAADVAACTEAPDTFFLMDSDDKGILEAICYKVNGGGMTYAIDNCGRVLVKKVATCLKVKDGYDWEAAP